MKRLTQEKVQELLGEFAPDAYSVNTLKISGGVYDGKQIAVFQIKDTLKQIGYLLNTGPLLPFALEDAPFSLVTLADLEEAVNEVTKHAKMNSIISANVIRVSVVVFENIASIALIVAVRVRGYDKKLHYEWLLESKEANLLSGSSL